MTKEVNHANAKRLTEHYQTNYANAFHQFQALF